MDADAPHWHGRVGGARGWAAPRVVAASDAEARPGYDAYDASEYVDEPATFEAKIEELASMLRQSEACVVYTGAGISTAAGIGDYASRAGGSVAPHHRAGHGTTSSRLDLKPTLAHHGLAALAEKGFVKHWVQQNHDRLAQKAGFPQAKINEIHGAWGDNKNGVKMMDDALRPDLLEWLVRWSERADMCIAFGSTLCGMNADQVAEACASRHPSSGQGLVIVGLQRTRFDAEASLRLWGLCDDVVNALCKQLLVKVPSTACMKRGQEWVEKHPRCMYHTPTRKASDPL